MKHFLKIIFLLVGSAYCGIAYGQTDTLQLSLRELMNLAAAEVPAIAQAKADWQYHQWQHRITLSQFKPQVNLNAELPSLDRSIDVITQPDGRDAFVERALMNNSIDMALRQYIPATGGFMFARTGLQRIDIFKNEFNPANTAYYTTPISLGFEQPLFGFKELKWTKVISKLTISEAERQYSEDKEAVVLDAAKLFFEILAAQMSLKAAHSNLTSIDTLSLLAQRKHEIGRAELTELLQLKINQKDAEASIAENRFRLQERQQQLLDLLGLPNNKVLIMQQPEQLANIEINEARALKYAQANRSSVIAFQRRLLEAERDLEEAIKGEGLELELSASFGLNKTAGQLHNAYQSLLDQERVKLSVYLPIMDGGRAKAKQEMAQAKQRSEWSAIQQERRSFERELRMRVREFEMARKKGQLSLEILDLTQKKYDWAKVQYRHGQVDMIALNLSYMEKNKAFSSYMDVLNSLWSIYFELRYLTLYDFELNTPIK